MSLGIPVHLLDDLLEAQHLDAEDAALRRLLAHRRGRLQVDEQLDLRHTSKALSSGAVVTVLLFLL